MDYTKLSNLIDGTFTIQKVWGYSWKKWDDVSKKMMTSDRYQQGYRKLYSVDTDKGKLDLGSGQLGTLLEAVFKDGKSDLNGKTFEVKSNGKSGMDIRYYFNERTEVKPLPDKELNGMEERGDDSAKDEVPEFTDEDIPF